MSIPSLEKEVRGRKAADSAEKSKESFEDKIKNIKPLRRNPETEKKGYVYPDEPRSEKAKEYLRKGKTVGYT